MHGKIKIIKNMNKRQRRKRQWARQGARSSPRIKNFETEEKNERSTACQI
jgi:hypothetical protein